MQYYETMVRESEDFCGGLYATESQQAVSIRHDDEEGQGLGEMIASAFADGSHRSHRR